MRIFPIVSYLCARMKKKRLKLVLVLMLCTICAKAIDVRSYTVGVDMGLPSIDIRSIAQDDMGYMWFGTTNGLLRYNGYTFNIFLEKTEPLLYDNHIRDILYWKEGLLVVRVQGDFCTLFDTHQGCFMLFPVGQERLKGYTRITIDSHQRLWLYNDRHEGVCISCDKRQFSCTYYSSVHPVPEEMRSALRVFQDNQGNPIDIIGQDLLLYHDLKTGKSHRIRVSDEVLPKPHYVLRYSVVTQGSLVWVSSYGRGIAVYDKQTGATEYIRKSGGVIQTDFILKICPDHQGNIWALQEYKGAACLSIDQRACKMFDISTGSREDPANFVKALFLLHDGSAYASGNTGELVRLKPGHGIVQRTSFDGDVILSGCEDRAHRLWLGGRTKGVHVGGRWYAADANDTTALSDNKVNSMVCDTKGRVWMATQNGQLDVAVGNYANGDIHFRHYLPASQYSALAVDHRGHIWVGSQSYVYNFDPDELLHNPEAYRQYNPCESQTGVNDVVHIMEDSRHQVWIATAGKGVFVYDNTHYSTAEGQHTSSDTLFHHISTADGLINDMVASVAEDNLGVVWIATQQGISRYDSSTGIIHNMTTDDNPSFNFHTDRTACLWPDGRLAFGTSGGIAVYTPSPMPHQPVISVQQHSYLTVTDVFINGINMRQWEDNGQRRVLSHGGELKLHNGENSLTFQFSDFNYNAGSKTLYNYWLEGYDRQWSQPSVVSQATYRNLPFGHYRLHVNASRDGGQVADIYLLDVAIAPPLWLSWRAWVVYVLLAVIVGYIVYRQLRTVYHLRQMVAVEKQMTDFKLRFFTNISHEFRTPLTIIHGSLDRIRQSKNLPEDIKRPISNIVRSESRMMRLVNQLLEFRKMEKGKLQLALQETDIIAFLRNIFDGFMDVAENKHIHYVFLPQIKSYKVFVDRGYIDKIAYNLLSNAFKYTPSGGDVTMRIHIDELSRQFSFSVTDTGVGVPKEKQGELFQRFVQSTFRGDSIGIGLNLTKELVDVHHGRITFADNNPQGSVFTVVMPTDMSVYSPADFLQADNILIREQGEKDVLTAPTEYQEMPPKPLNNRRILIVEDDVEVLKYTKDLMSPYFHVVTAIDGNEAWMQLETQDIDLVVTDVMMPVMDGYELTRKINTDPRFQDIPVIMLTAVSDAQTESKGLDTGADAFLTKPFENEVLVSTCISLIGKRDLLRKKYATEQHTELVPKVVKEEVDGKFLSVFDTWIELHLGDTGLSVDDMAVAMQLGRTVFYQKVKSLTGMTPNDYLRKRRLDRAASMFREGYSNVSEVAYKTGFSSTNNFTTLFKQQFGTTPKKYQMGKDNFSH